MWLTWFLQIIVFCLQRLLPRVHEVLDILSLFAMAAGQHVNFHKSYIYFSSNTSNQDKIVIVNILNIQHKITIAKYLGIHNIVF